MSNKNAAHKCTSISQDLLNILSQRISGDFWNTKYRHHIDFISFLLICRNFYTHAHIPTVVKRHFQIQHLQAKSGFNTHGHELLIMW